MSGAGDPTTRPRRILMTVDAVGGVWRYAMDAAAGLRAHGTDMVFAGLGPPPSAGQRAEAEALGSLVWLEQPLDWMVENEAALDGIPGALQRLTLETGADLLHLNLPSQAAGLRVDRPVVVVSHSCVVTWFRAVRDSAPPPDWHWQARRNEDGFAAARLAVAPSRSHAALLARCYERLPPVVVVPNAVAPLQPAAQRDPVVFAAARWWDEGKNAARLDEAAASIAWPVLAAGPLQGPNNQGVGFSNVQALGPLPPSAVRAHQERAAIFISPSCYEPFGLAPLEAASGGCALVLADIPTYREIWEDAALFAPAGDAQALAEATNRLIRDGALRRDLARRAEARAAGYTRSRHAASLLDCYAKAA